jgi:hypothetical protein
MSALPTLPGLSPNEIKIFQTFHPFAFDKTAKAYESAQRFVHYTSAETALKMFRNREVWMRKSSCMNDFMEIQHGFACLRETTNAHAADLKRIFDGAFPGFIGKLEPLFNSWLPALRNDTYIACLSEHDVAEDELGRLSMWRAYGGSAGVAVVLNGAPFIRPSDALKAYTNPVAYLGLDGFDREFKRFLEGVEANAPFVKALGEQFVYARVFDVFRSAVLCTKHPGFHEEREWRVIYSPSYAKSNRIKTEIESINGTPQPICKIPLANVPEEGLTGIELPELVERVIIGPNSVSFGDPGGIYRPPIFERNRRCC